MFKRHLMKLMIGLVLTLTLLCTLALSVGSASVHKASTPPFLACGADAFPPCE